MSGSYFALNQKYNSLLALIAGGGGAGDLSTVLTLGNSAGSTDIDMNSNDILLVNNIDLTTINGSAYPPVVGADTLTAVLVAGNNAGASSIAMNNNAISGISTATATSFVGALTGNATSATTATNIAGGLGGSVPYQTAINTTALLANGTAGQFLKSNGTTLAPSWSNTAPPVTPTLSQVLVAGNSAGATTINMNSNAISNITTATATTFVGALTGNATSATNIAGGLGGSVPYQTAVNTTALLANGTAGQLLQSNGTTLAPSWVTSTPAVATVTTTLNFLSSGATNSKQSIIYPSTTTITGSSITAQISGIANTEQVYTLGKSIPDRYVVMGDSYAITPLTDAGYSADGINWVATGEIFQGGGSGYGICAEWNGTMWVAGGSGVYSLMYSYDGITWTAATTPMGTYTLGVVWTGTKWFIGGQTGGNTIGYSTDGINWTGVSMLLNNNVSGLGWNGKMLIATGASSGAATNTIAYSTDDGLTWTAATSAFVGGNGNNAIWNGTIWVACGYGNNSTSPSNSANGKLAYSYDGITWTLSSWTFGVNCNDIVWGGGVGGSGRWVACGQYIGVGNASTLAYSNDGITWTGLGTSTFSSNGTALCWSGTQFVAGGNGGNSSIATSPDGIVWTTVQAAGAMFATIQYIRMNNLRSTRIVFPTNRTVAVGSGTNRIVYSSTGASVPPTWTASSSGNALITTQGNGVAWNGTRWVAVGQGTNSIAYSTDGVTWTGNLLVTFSTSGNGVAWNDTRWVAVGQGTNSIAYSSDGITWTGIGTAIFSTSGNGVAWNGTYFVAVGSGTNRIAYSTDGITWTGSASGNALITTQGNGISWSGTRFVAVGSGTNTIAYSSDGITWVASASGTATITTSGNGVAWNENKFVAVGSGTNSIAYSSDGITWTGAGAAIFTTQGNGITWNGAYWVGLGQGTNTIATSANGVSWIGQGTAIFSSVGKGVAWNAGRATIPTTSITLNEYGTGLTDKLDVVAGPYTQTGFSNFTLTIQA